MRTSLARERLSAVHRMFLNILCGSPECFRAADPSLQEHTMRDPLGETEMIGISRADPIPPSSHLNRRHLLGMGLGATAAAGVGLGVPVAVVAQMAGAS